MFCEWKLIDKESHTYKSSCRREIKVSFNYGNTIANGFKFCPSCGREIKEVFYEEEDE